MICIACGINSTAYLCDDCKKIVDIESLCHEVFAYYLGKTDNSYLRQVEEYPLQEEKFEEIIFYLCEYLETPRKEYVQICGVAKDKPRVRKDKRAWLVQTALKCMNASELSKFEQNRVKGILLEAYYNDYNYMDAEAIANEYIPIESVDFKEMPKQMIETLGKYYTYTRRYDLAEMILSLGCTITGEENSKDFDVYFTDLLARKNGTKKAYEPNAKEKTDEVKRDYYTFLTSVGVSIPKQKPTKIKVEDYPPLIEETNAGFTSFVAFDFETTGLDLRDKITEIGAIKVIDGEVIEDKHFIFQEFVNTEGKIIPEYVENKTGISNEMVKDARYIWEVFPEFAEFIESYPLIGFNCKAFDNRYLISAGRHSNCIIKNKFFDVMLYAKQFKSVYPDAFRNGKVSLANLSLALGITNDEAHRALSDAITTAKVYLKLINL